MNEETHNSNEPEDNRFWQRTRLMLGENGQKSLADAVVIVAGCGGVGSFAIEALARSGVGHLVLIDHDTIEQSNINRQLPALRDTLGEEKTKLLAQRIAQINPDCQVTPISAFYDSNMNKDLISYHPDYILDCIDSIDSKKDLISFALEYDIPILCSMGMARKKDPTRLSIVELEKTIGDPMAKILRLWKRKNRIRKKIMTVSSDELPVAMEKGAPLPSMIFVPGTAGLIMASKCVDDLLKKADRQEV